MLTAMVAVDNILAGITDKTNLWDVNTELEYHEQKHDSQVPAPISAVPARVDEGPVDEKNVA